jgi:hypothetical protein
VVSRLLGATHILYICLWPEEIGSTYMHILTIVELNVRDNDTGGDVHLSKSGS